MLLIHIHYALPLHMEQIHATRQVRITFTHITEEMCTVLDIKRLRNFLSQTAYYVSESHC